MPEGLLDERGLIQTFVSHLAQKGHPSLRVERWPDEENRGEPDIDALAGPFAIEHTSIDTIQNQRRDNDWFGQVANAVEAEFTDAVLPCRLRVRLPWEGVSRGQDWPSLTRALATWIRNTGLYLPDGRHEVHTAGIPFSFTVLVDGRGSPGVFFGRYAPDDSSLPQRLAALLQRKASKLIRYKGRGFTTILLVESNDFVLMNWADMLEALRQASSHRLPEGVDQLWFAEADRGLAPIFRDFSSLVCRSD